MPTGYTALIEDGKVKSPAQFLHACLRNFGICWCLRDNDVPMTEEDISGDIAKAIQDDIDYHKKMLDDAKKRLKEFEALTDEDLFNKYMKETDEKYTRYMEYYAKALQQNEVYDKYLAAIKAWNPSEDFKNIKQFAIEQIEMSKDSNPTYWANESDQVGIPTREKFEEMKDMIKADLRHPIVRDINYHQEELGKAIKRLDDALEFYRRFKAEISEVELEKEI